MKYFSLLWLSVVLSMVGAKEKRGRYVPIEEPKSDDHRALQSNNNRVTGIAYECNDNDFPLELPKVRRYAPGDVIRVCLKPEIRTEKRGIVMRAVDTMNFIGQGSGISQKVVEFKKEAFTTLSLCIPGQLVCSFKTKLREELFWGLEGDEVNITGVALVTMEYIDKSFALYGLADTDIAVDLTFLVKRVAPPPGAILGVPGAESIQKQGCDPHWWCQYPDWFKILMIILLLILLCCCCCMCLTIPCMIREMMEDDKEREERREFVREQKMREEHGGFYPEEQYYEDPHGQSYRDRPQPFEQEDSYRGQPPPPPQQQQGSYRPQPPQQSYQPEEPARQSSYRVPRASNSSFRAQQRPAPNQRYEY
eukprot:CAMPEP_0113643366 /NCGR_PEP_ID=MMETSP0017_2-20120614/22802_1 /TAXON_ID=2856 /ORGANISM="Cylindrotheca closterium" /LENGTH=363 /DNA_ID=CAMNT_0000554877 /DNA_START=8 /DNA_END=1099 /DNA_ORIENTATION=+ /assembly_acc=CAM_ASM_000147